LEKLGQKLGAPHLKIWGPKHENSGLDFGQRPTWRRITSEWNVVSSIRKVHADTSLDGSLILFTLIH